MFSKDFILGYGAGKASGGGPAPSVEPKDVNFIDYDGTVLYAYTAQEAAALDALPTNPSHTGLTAQGWNYTLAQMKAEITAQGKCTIGQMYVTDDGKTRLYIHIPDTAHGNMLTFDLRYTQTVTRGVEVDWGDDTTPETFTGTSAAVRSHTYAHSGDYVVTLKVLSGSVSFVGASSSSIYGNTSNYYNRAKIYKVEIGSSVSSIGNYAFQYCYALQSVTIPYGETSIGNYAFQYCYALQAIIIPSSATNIGIYAFVNCYSLRSITIPTSVTSIGNFAFNYCLDLSSITIPNSVTNIDSSVFQNCYSLRSVTIPTSVTSIGGSAFNSCYSLGEIHFKHTTPPTVAGSNTWSSVPRGCIIYVPSGSLSAYKSATNYPSSSTYTYVEE